MLQTMPNSREIALVFILLKYLVLTRAHVLFLTLSLLFMLEVSYAPRALNKDTLKAKLTNMLQTMPNSKKTCLVRRLKVTVGELSNRTEVLLSKAPNWVEFLTLWSYNVRC